jgi:CheY-like chemotaxis protein
MMSAQSSTANAPGIEGDAPLVGTGDLASTLAALVGSISSELTEPIDRILVAAARARVSDLADEPVQQLNEVESSAADLVTIINGLGDLANAWQGELALETVAFSLRGLLHDAVAVVTARAGAKRVQLGATVATDLHDTLVGDPGRLRDVIIRLLRRAVDESERGSVTVTVSGVEGPRRTMSLRFDVEDLAPQHRDGFAPHPADRGRGTENTLSHMITSAVVVAMGGQVWTDDRAVVHFLVELGVGEASEPDRPAPTPLPTTGLPVLIVSESGDDRRGLLTALGSAGMAPIAVTHPDEAPASWRIDQQDDAAARAAVIYGSQHPFDTAEAFLNRTHRRIPVTLVVPSGRRGDAARCRSLGVAGYLAMPIVHSDLAEAVVATVQASRDAGSNASLVTRHWLREGRSSLRVLLADPSPISQRLIIDILEARGHAVTAVTDGATAVEALSTGSFDVLAVDMQMPRSADGVDPATMVRSSDLGGQIPIVAITTYSGQTDPVRFQTVGLDHRLAKPWRPEELTVAIENAATQNH